ncbi:MAG: MauE/DoxX family redox-associated membrane protein [Acidimicrobiales bacterium]
MGALAGPFVAAAVLLGLGGALELRRPAATVGAMRAMHLPSSPLAVRLGGGAVLAVSVVAVVWPTRWVAAAVGGAYLLLSGFVLAALLRRVPIGSCGCFGRDDTPATAGHLLVNVAAAAVAATVAMGPGPRGWASADLDPHPVAVVVFGLLTVSSALFAYMGLTLVPRLAAAGNRLARSSA